MKIMGQLTMADTAEYVQILQLASRSIVMYPLIPQEVPQEFLMIQ